MRVDKSNIDALDVRKHLDTNLLRIAPECLMGQTCFFHSSTFCNIL